MSANPPNFQEQIKARFSEGLAAHFNDGYDDWLKWCDVLYEPNAHYNVYGKRMTLQEYKSAMKALMTKYDIQIGEVKNMLVVGEWGAIRYVVHITDRATGAKIEQNTMEFVQWKENPELIGARVVEGWALSDSPLSET